MKYFALLLGFLGCASVPKQEVCFQRDRCKDFPVDVDCDGVAKSFLDQCLKKNMSQGVCESQYFYALGYCNMAMRACDPDWTPNPPTEEDEPEPTGYDKRHI